MRHKKSAADANTLTLMMLILDVDPRAAGISLEEIAGLLEIYFGAAAHARRADEPPLDVDAQARARVLH